MSAPEWLAWPSAVSIISRAFGNPTTDVFYPPLFQALTAGTVHSRLDNEELDPEWWREYTDLHQALERHGGAAFELHHADLQHWLLPPKRKAETRGRKPKWDWDGCEADAESFLNTNGLPDTLAELERHMAGWFERTVGESPVESQIREKATVLFAVYKAEK
jgi:hypothetical protein